MKSSFLTLILLLLQLPAFAQGDKAQGEFILKAKRDSLSKTKAKSKNADIETAAKMLALDFAPFVKTMNRDIHTYNYRDKQFLKLTQNPLDLSRDSQKAIDYVNEWTDTIKKFTPKESGYLGWGFYTANNPTSSTGYGGENGEFAMVIQIYEKGASLLDLRSLFAENSFPMSKETYEYLKNTCQINAQAPLSKEGPNSYYAFDKVQFSRKEECNAIFVKAMENLNLAGLIYRWKGEYTDVCNSAQIDDSAFINFNGKVDKSTIDLLVNPDAKMIGEAQKIESKKAKAKDFFLGEDTYNLYNKVALFINQTPQNEHRDLMSPFVPKDQKKQSKLLAEIKKETFGCDKKYAQEDAPSYDPMKALGMALKYNLLNNTEVGDIQKISCQ